jgi:PAS domain S-box-containing protein
MRLRKLRNQVQEAEGMHAALAGHVEILERFGSEPFMVFDGRGLIRGLNESAEKLFGFETKDLYGQSILRLIPNLNGPPPSARGRIEIQRRDGARMLLEFRAARTEGERKIYLFFTDPARSKREAEPELAMVERVVGRILGQLEEPLTTINGYSELALATVPADSPVRDELEKIASASERASRVAGVLLTFTGKRAASRVAIDLNAALRAMEPEIRAEVSADIVIRTGIEPAPAMVNEEGLREAIVILCAAAERRAGSGPCRIEISVETSGVNRVLKIADNGQLLSEEAQAHLFEPLYLNAAEIGVELSPVYGLVHGWGGEIRVSSGAGTGTTFELLIPVTR